MLSSAVPSTLINSGSVSRSLFGWSAMSVGTQRSPPSPFLTPYLRTYNHYSRNPICCQVCGICISCVARGGKTPFRTPAAQATRQCRTDYAPQETRVRSSSVDAAVSGSNMHLSAIRQPDVDVPGQKSA